MGVLSSLFGSLGDRLAQRHTKECKLLNSSLKQFARFFFTQVSKRWFFPQEVVGITVENPYTFDNSPFFYVRMKSTSLFLVTKLRLNCYCEPPLMWRFYKKGKNGRNRLRLMSVFNVYNHVFLFLRQFIAWSRRKKDSNSKCSPSSNTIIMQISMFCPRGGEDYGIGWGLSFGIRYVSTN